MPSSRRPRTSTTPRCWPTSRRASVSRWSASRRARSETTSGSRSAAGKQVAARSSTWDDITGNRTSAATFRGPRPGPAAKPELHFDRDERSSDHRCACPAGAFREHVRVLRALGANVLEVRLPRDLSGLDGLVIPGGESTTIMHLAGLYELDDAIRDYPGPILGTCAGMIVLDRDHLDLADLVVDRNAYGRQVGASKPMWYSPARRCRCAASSSERRVFVTLARR